MRQKILKAKKWPVALVGLALFLGVGAFLFLSGGKKDGLPLDIPPGMVFWGTVTAKEMLPSPQLLSLGKMVYEIRCTTCHGSKGEGNGPASFFLKTPPRDFSRLTFKFRTTQSFPSDLDLFRSITAGFPVYGMPSFRYLSEEERWALVHYVKKLARDGWLFSLQKEEGNEFDAKEAESLVVKKMAPGATVIVGKEHTPDENSLSRGKAVYNNVCLPCHGPTGQGDGPSASTLKDSWGHPISPRDYTSAPIFYKGGWRREDIVRTLVTGIPGTPMPSLLANTDDLRQLWDVACYVDSLRRQKAAK